MGVRRSELGGRVLDVAPRLLGTVIRRSSPEGTVAVRLTEVEAYDGPNDPGSHAYRGRTARNAVMFGPAGFLYVYFTYGMHFCMNVSAGPDGQPSAVLLRAGEVIEGVDLARRRRGFDPGPDQPAVATPATAGDSTSPGRPRASTPGRDSESALGRTGKSMPGRDSEPAPGGDPSPVPGRDPEPVPGRNGKSMPYRDSEPAPGGDSLPVPGRDSEPVPGRDSESLPGRDSGPVPGRDPESVPGHDARSAPGRGPKSTAGRGSKPDRELARGPARMCVALGIDRAADGSDLLAPDAAIELLPGPGYDGEPATGPRVGLREAADRPWRFWIPGEPTVSPYRPHVPKRR